MSKINDISGQRFGRLEVMEKAGVTKSRYIKWRCLCDCGKEVVVSGHDLRSGKTLSCGCLNRELASKRMFKHGFTKTLLPYVRAGMLYRCNNPKHVKFKHYGGRGITVCNEWKDNPESFYMWAIDHGYKKGLTLDRIDNDGDYCPENCRWVTQKVNCNNQGDNYLLTYNGYTKTLSEWSDATGINRATISSRKKLGWTDEEALCVPIHVKIKAWRKKNGKKI